MITRRSLFLGAAAVILTPDVLMPILPERLICVPIGRQCVVNGKLIVTGSNIPGDPYFGWPSRMWSFEGPSPVYDGVWVSHRQKIMVRLNISERQAW